MERMKDKNIKEFYSEFDLVFKGSDALERDGVVFSLSGLDHPVTKLLQSPFKVSKKTLALVSISKKQVSLKKLASTLKKAITIYQIVG